MTTTIQTNAEHNTGLRIDHVADFYRRYPGELVTFHTRVTVQRPVSDLTVRVTIPQGLELGDYSTSLPNAALPSVEFAPGTTYVTWRSAGEIAVGSRWEHHVQAQVGPNRADSVLESRAYVRAGSNTGHDERPLAAGETASIAVKAKGAYLQYLPALYRKDELMGRFLMLFESFWGPIEGQIDQMPYFFDPKMTPSPFLDWLASWMNLVFDERWSEAKRRRLLQSAISFYRRRGTRHGLQEYLEIYTGRTPQIIEHRANNFSLGPDARLGPGIALGTANVPYTFSVTLRLPPASTADGQAARRAEVERQRMIESIIEAEKPAHTTYTLQIDIDPDIDPDYER